MDTHKPILLLKLDEDTRDPDQMYLLDASEPIGHYLQYDVYAFYPGRLLGNDKKMRDSIAPVIKMMATGDTCIHFAGYWWVSHFEGGDRADGFHSIGGLHYGQRSKYKVVKYALIPQKDDQLYEFSYWVRLSKMNYLSPEIRLDMLDSTDKVIASESIRAAESADNSGLWFRAGKYIKIPGSTRSVTYTIVPTARQSYISLDEVMIRPADAIIISKLGDGNIMVNNHLMSAD